MSDLFDFDQPASLYAVMGNPVAHSRSPQIHQMFAEQFGLRVDYQKIQVDLGGLPQAVANFRAAGGRGLNITLPFKLDAFRLADELSPRALLAEAVNTISFTDNDQIIGDNTDGAGLCRDIMFNLERPISGRRVLVVGAGGAVRGVLGPMLETYPELLVIANRTVDKAVELERHFSGFRSVAGCGFDDLTGQQFDIVINGTSAGVTDEIPSIPHTVFASGALAYDMLYGDRPTVFIEWAERHGASQTADGIGMLVEQAAESFAVWHDRTPQTGPVIAALRNGRSA